MRAENRATASSRATFEAAVGLALRARRGDERVGLAARERDLLARLGLGLGEDLLRPATGLGQQGIARSAQAHCAATTVHTSSGRSERRAASAA